MRHLVLKLRHTFQSFAKTKNIIPMAIILLLLYEILFPKRDIRIKNCSANFNSESTRPKSSPLTVNIKRIKMFYIDNGDFFIPSSLKQIDWHNYTQIENDRQRVGIGEHGKAAKLHDSEEPLQNRLLFNYGFNAALSDRIALNRALPDVRHRGCKKRLYLESLPTVSIVIAFHDEYWSSLLRTVYSVIERSPESLIKEIFLVDDGSTEAHLREKLDNYTAEYIPKVKVLHMANRTGIVGARLLAANTTKADVLLFMDSHMEVNVNWLPPLLEPIALDYRTAVVPIVDEIDTLTLEYKITDNGARGSFDWWFTYTRLPILPQDMKKMPEPFETPVMSGGVVAISRHFFWELNGYDPELKIWGGEQFELSFKIWQCGGRILEAPCSRVGHIPASTAPPGPVLGHANYLARNLRRVADVWMDEYAEYIYTRRSSDKNVDPGDLKKQKELRVNLKCKSFKWFMNQIAFDLIQKYPVIEPKPLAEGQLHPELNPQWCADVGGEGAQWSDDVVLKTCRFAGNHRMHQNFVLTWFNDIILNVRPMCWYVPSESNPDHFIKSGKCKRGEKKPQWTYNEKAKWVVLGKDKCLDHATLTMKLFISPCDENAKSQRWEFDVVHTEQLNKWKKELTTERIIRPVEEWTEKDTDEE